MIEITRWKRRDGEGGIVEAIRWSGELTDIPRLREFGVQTAGCLTGRKDGHGDCDVIVAEGFAVNPGDYLVKLGRRWGLYSGYEFHRLFLRKDDQADEAAESDVG